MNQQTRLDKFKNKNITNPIERDRVLMVYGGIFKHNIQEFSEKIAKRNKPERNLAR